MNDGYIDSCITSIITYLNKDLEELGKLKVACFPISGLLYGFKDPISGKPNSGSRFKEFFKNYMRKADSKYNKTNIPEYFYSFLRNKITHEAGIAGGFSTENSERYRDLHLKEHRIGGDKIVYIHPIEYRNDFLKALKFFEEDYHISSVKQHAIINFRKSCEESMKQLRKYPIDLPLVEGEPSTDGTNSKTLFITIARD